MSADPIQLMFGGMAKLGPGSERDTLRALDLLPGGREIAADAVVVDAGCGSGRQTLTLAKALPATVHAVDAEASFLTSLKERAAAAGLGGRVETCVLDLLAIPDRFPRVDLLWSEGAAYNVGFEHALTTWARCVTPGCCAVVSELTWMVPAPPAGAARFFRTAYPPMQSNDENVAAAGRAGFTCVATHTLPRDAWVDGYYDELAIRAERLAGHAEAAVRAIAEETLREIEVFEEAFGTYGYVFYVLERTP